jgi:hypothetical protein
MKNLGTGGHGGRRGKNSVLSAFSCSNLLDVFASICVICGQMPFFPNLLRRNSLDNSQFAIDNPRLTVKIAIVRMVMSKRAGWRGADRRAKAGGIGPGLKCAFRQFPAKLEYDRNIIINDQRRQLLPIVVPLVKPSQTQSNQNSRFDGQTTPRNPNPVKMLHNNAQTVRFRDRSSAIIQCKIHMDNILHRFFFVIYALFAVNPTASLWQRLPAALDPAGMTCRSSAGVPASKASRAGRGKTAKSALYSCLALEYWYSQKPKL